jgi:hypothetical protein
MEVADWCPERGPQGRVEGPSSIPPFDSRARSSQAVHTRFARSLMAGPSTRRSRARSWQARRPQGGIRGTPFITSDTIGRVTYLRELLTHSRNLAYTGSTFATVSRTLHREEGTNRGIC